MQCGLSYNSSARAFRQILVCCALSVSAGSLVAQDTPLISGGIGFLTDRNAGENSFQPVLAPLIAAPLGSRLLVESRANIANFYQQDATGAFPSQFTAALQFLQLDYIANPRLTIVAGKFLTPFGTYNERLSTIWVPYFQNGPASVAIGTRTSGSSNGGMMRGALIAKPAAQLNYVAYFSGSSAVHEFKAARTVGMQASVFLPGPRLEVGMSYQRFLQQVHNNSFGFDVWWLPPHSAYELRSEYSHGARSQGYWIESAYRFSRFGGQDSLIGRFQPVFRLQQTFRNQPNFPGQADGLPAVDTKQLDFGFDYHLPKELRFNSSYSRSFAATNKNIWDISLTYRFLFPAWRGKK